MKALRTSFPCSSRTGIIDEIVENRGKEGKFKDFYDFCERLYGHDINRRAVESLIKSGALDGLAKNRRQMLVGAEKVMADIDDTRSRNCENQLALFDLLDEPEAKEAKYIPLPDVEEFPVSELLAMEKEVTEIYLSGHPLKEYEPAAERMKASRLASIISEDEDRSMFDGQHVTLLCMISGVKLKTTKNNETMAFVQIEDYTAGAEMIVFPRVLTENAAGVRNGAVVRIEGRVSVREEEDPKIICESVLAITPDYDGAPAQKQTPRGNYAQPQRQSAPAQKKGSSRPGLYLRCESVKCAELEQAKKVLRIFDGLTPVYVYCTDGSGLMSAPRELWVSLNDVMLAELERILGEGSVKVVE